MKKLLVAFIIALFIFSLVNASSLKKPEWRKGDFWKYEMETIGGKNKSIISEIVMLPQMTYGKRHATFNIYMAPIDFSIVGTVHSHPSGYPIPSQDDLITFSKNGIIHIIIAYPYDDNSWKAYDYNGKEVKLEIIE